MDLDLRQLKFLEYYLGRDTGSYGNALQSALKAGYSQEYAEKITSVMPKWLSEFVGKFESVTKQEIIQGILIETKSDKSSDRLKAWELLGKTQGLFNAREPLTDDNKPIPIMGEVWISGRTDTLDGQ